VVVLVVLVVVVVVVVLLAVVVGTAVSATAKFGMVAAVVGGRVVASDDAVCDTDACIHAPDNLCSRLL
jgi:hypothetical protein